MLRKIEFHLNEFNKICTLLKSVTKMDVRKINKDEIDSILKENNNIFNISAIEYLLFIFFSLPSQVVEHDSLDFVIIR